MTIDTTDSPPSAMKAVFTPQSVEIVIDRALVNDLATKLSRAQVAHEAISAVNIASCTVEQRIEIGKHYRIVTDQMEHARHQYDVAFEAWAKAGFPE